MFGDMASEESASTAPLSTGVDQMAHHTGSSGVTGRGMLRSALQMLVQRTDQELGMSLQCLSVRDQARLRYACADTDLAGSPAYWISCSPGITSSTPASGTFASGCRESLRYLFVFVGRVRRPAACETVDQVSQHSQVLVDSGSQSELSVVDNSAQTDSRGVFAKPP